MSEPTPYSDFLDMELMSRLPSLEIQAKFLVAGFLSGLHRSPFRGFSVEFKEYRAYQPGDELKMIDWKAYARNDRLSIRLREEETNLSAYILVDASASMNFKGPRAVMSKWQYSRSLAAAFILFLRRQLDAASLAIVGDKVESYLPPSLKVSDFHMMMSALHREANAGPCDLQKGLEMIAMVARRRSLVLVFSDFYSDPKLLEAPLGHLRYMGCEPMFFQIMDPRELDFDFDEPVLLQELESSEKITLSPDLLRKDYLKAITDHNEQVADTTLKFGGDYIPLRTDEPPLKAIGAYIAKRSGFL